jgi:hypothetical protein
MAPRADTERLGRERGARQLAVEARQQPGANISSRRVSFQDLGPAVDHQQEPEIFPHARKPEL